MLAFVMLPTYGQHYSVNTYFLRVTTGFIPAMTRLPIAQNLFLRGFPIACLPAKRYELCVAIAFVPATLRMPVYLPTVQFIY